MDDDTCKPEDYVNPWFVDCGGSEPIDFNKGRHMVVMNDNYKNISKELDGEDIDGSVYVIEKWNGIDKYYFCGNTIMFFGRNNAEKDCCVYLEGLKHKYCVYASNVYVALTKLLSDYIADTSGTDVKMYK